ncbi:EcsC protein family protein [Micromonospora yangpuensis]|uniref:EcsC protein family protein n=1 Tax=Micromonospora yangpuensis TaxID=683228 RepID=A0A1C6UH53_9ACTN|nr:EcsC protein family protein [Micromonospora yangpuensis]
MPVDGESTLPTPSSATGGPGPSGPVPPAPRSPQDPPPPAAPAGSRPPAQPAGAAEDAPEGPPARLWDRMREDPQYAPEHLALEAVRRLGPEARQWARKVRAERPGATPEALAELAVKRFVNRARLSGAVSGAAGLPGAVIDVGVLAWTQARMVLHIAAAYGVDPEHTDRATDLLVLQKVHKAAASARLALGVAAGRERAGALFGTGSQTPLGRVMLRLGVKLAQMAGVRAAKRVFAKMVPGAAIVLGTWANSSATKSLADRSRALYRDAAAGDPQARPD